CSTRHQIDLEFHLSVEDLAILLEILQENLERLVRPQVASSPTCLQSPL
ncbi:hypothetical protein Tco_1050261, partial [Tanacetum coccineum]